MKKQTIIGTIFIIFSSSWLLIYGIVFQWIGIYTGNLDTTSRNAILWSVVFLIFPAITIIFSFKNLKLFDTTIKVSKVESKNDEFINRKGIVILLSVLIIPLLGFIYIWTTTPIDSLVQYSILTNIMSPTYLPFPMVLSFIGGLTIAFA